MTELKTGLIDGLKAGPDDGLEDGQFLAYASTWIREPDSYGDVVKRGAFASTLKDWAKSGNTLPILFGHNMSDPDYNIGGAVEAREDDHGLLVKGQLDLDNPKAQQVYRLLKGRRVSQLSFAFDNEGDGVVELEDGRKARELRKLKLYEVSIVPVGANQDTEVLAVKAAAESLRAGYPDGEKAGRTISAKNLASLKAARTSLDEVIAAADQGDDTDEASKAVSPAEVQEHKADDHAARSAKSVALATVALSL